MAERRNSGKQGKITIGWVTITVLAFACCVVQQEWVEAAAQSTEPTTAVEKTRAATTKPGVADGAWSPALTGERRPLYRLQKSDVVELQFTFSPELDETVSVQPDGFIPLKNARQVFAEGATISELEEVICRAYSGVLHEPEVTVSLREFDKPYFIAAGEVMRPGKYELHSDTTVTEAVAIAGGFSPRAKHSQVIVFRRASGDMVETHLLDVKSMLSRKTLQEDIHLRPGDMVYAPQNLISKIKPYLPASGLSMYATPQQF